MRVFFPKILGIPKICFKIKIQTAIISVISPDIDDLIAGSENCLN